MRKQNYRHLFRTGNDRCPSILIVSIPQSDNFLLDSIHISIAGVNDVHKRFFWCILGNTAWNHTQLENKRCYHEKELTISCTRFLDKSPFVFRSSLTLSAFFFCSSLYARFEDIFVCDSNDTICEDYSQEWVLAFHSHGTYNPIYTLSARIPQWKPTNWPSKQSPFQTGSKPPSDDLSSFFLTIVADVPLPTSPSHHKRTSCWQK